MTSVPSTPRTPKVKKGGFRTAAATPKSVLKRTILNIDPNSSYLEENDATYADETTELSFGEDDEEVEDYSEDEDEVEGDLLPSVAEGDDDGEDDDDEEDDGLVPTTTRQPTAAERALFEVEDDEESTANAASPVKPTTTAGGSESGVRKFIVKHELVRKALHSSIGVFTLWLYTLGVHQTQLIVPLSTLFTVIFANDFFRFRNPELNKKIVAQFWFLIREKEENAYNGTLYFLVGLILIFSFCPKDISLMSVLLLSWADTAASTFGRQFGKYTPKIGQGKSLAGSLASFAMGTVSCYILYGYFIPVYNAKVNQPGDIMWTPETSKLSFPVYAVLSGLIASVSELIDIGGLDDNFTIPVLSGIFLYSIVHVFQV